MEYNYRPRYRLETESQAQLHASAIVLAIHLLTQLAKQ